ncbi:hypothetical protein ABT009_22335 [Streptomyces sp. NPDC002896]|uniref:hypothetical protein n=1 Tax=Streptomyces sp. NPDC002896 TaxID=3154438 RepID=UPI00332F014E
MGLHQCIGRHVARLEAEALLTALARRVERIELTGTPHRHPTTPCARGRPYPARPADSLTGRRHQLRRSHLRGK